MPSKLILRNRIIFYFVPIEFLPLIVIFAATVILIPQGKMPVEEAINQRQSLVY